MSLGVLLIQLGTPDEPTKGAVRRYLRQFLGDPRVIEAPRWKWWIALNLFILTTRPKRSAEKYQRIWHPVTGSPLKHWTEQQLAGLKPLLPADWNVRYAMRIGSPSIDSVLREMIDQGVDRLIAFPLFPQYSATTTASVYDGLFQALMKERCVPALRVVPPYASHPGYIHALATIIEEERTKLGWNPDHYLLSFHGIPVSYVEKGDPYPTYVRETTAKLIERLGWRPGSWTQTYQSRFGRDPWLEPYTEDTLTKLAQAGAKRVFVALPGFTADCLETIDEIGREADEAFRHAGGETLFRCPCLNAHPAWLEAMRQIITEEAAGWPSGGR
jgi:ferrochelatase